MKNVMNLFKKETPKVEFPSDSMTAEFEELEKGFMELKAYEKSFKSKREKLMGDLTLAFRKYGIESWQGTYLDMNNVAPRTGLVLDSGRLKAEMPDVYNKYLTEKQYSGYVRVK